MAGRSRQKQVIAGFALALLGAACSTGLLGKLDPVDMPAELPPELKQKFEIQDPSQLQPAPSDKPVPAKAAETSVQEAAQPAPLAPAKAGEPAPAVPAMAKKPAAPAARSGKPGLKYPSRRSQPFPIWVGEQQVYEITYFGMLAGTLTLDVLPFKFVGDRKVYPIRGRAVSSKVFSLFYTLDDVVESFLDYEGLFSHRFHLLLNETKQTRDALELYDNEKMETFYWNRWNHKARGYKETKKFYKMKKPFPQDSVSALYYLRTLPMKEGMVHKFPVVSEGKSWDAEVTVVRREMMTTPMGKVQTVVVKPVTKYRGIAAQKGDSYIWLTDDDRRIVVRVEAKAKIGAVIADLVSTKPGVAPGQEAKADAAPAADPKRSPNGRGGATK